MTKQPTTPPPERASDSVNNEGKHTSVEEDTEEGQCRVSTRLAKKRKSIEQEPHEEEPETAKPARPVRKAARRIRSVNTSPRTLEKKATSRGRPSLDQVAEAQEAGQSAYPTPRKTPRRIVAHDDELAPAEGSRKNDGLILLLRVMEEAEESDSDGDSDRGDGASPPPGPRFRAGYQQEGPPRPFALSYADPYPTLSPYTLPRLRSQYPCGFWYKDYFDDF
ncbi:hypothetical protein B9479_003471 [Cryptococcus floricola]|uniref:Uncharacterized protein n=1 Tax=Cryptococcus floricola TaxID=2591691 RepID=A0A5D3AZY5_9TREE|nr:hypothetical protein B9479_003471 [Cryptococcus floricola]